MGDVTTLATEHRTGRRRPELAAFLRSRRARVTPADVGMPPGLRRRTPGLRREEVAQLSGVGVTWYTWLEQGRPINASGQVLDAIARTLRLDRSEREHLYHLAEVPQAPDAEDPSGVLPEVGPELQGILDALDPRPAVIYNARYDILASNAAYRDLFFVQEMASSGRRNVLWALCTVDEASCPLVFREVELPRMVAQLRGAYGRHVGEPEWESYVRDLSAASDTFARLWASGDVVRPGPHVKTFRHEAVGEIRMTSVSLSINGMPDCRIVTYTPADDLSERRLAGVRDRCHPLG
ncbi:helix-turn-helix domain-containing protein [Streptomyces sp. TRM66268-LWL]|uniref:Helix-turn-helix domain-containing protein n=1 Tax=Streptomyces polyasparticus TaxID=2767826 RepID=A0ABR7SN31_9ACTN|nr:helix-turn-helix transcriptional regulator [Streptomyces polyasparticus]MBC9716259.1 helix-turn-helix domain-containing protein [Streptomyces polyasparticus]